MAPVSLASGFRKREFIVTMEDAHPQEIKFVCFKDERALLGGVGIGERVKVGFRIRGKEHKERHHVDLEGVQLTRREGGGAA